MKSSKAMLLVAVASLLVTACQKKHDDTVEHKTVELIENAGGNQAFAAF